MNVDLVEKLDSCTYSIRRIPNTQSCNRRPLCSTFTFENVCTPKKPSFIPKKDSKERKKYIIFKIYHATFLCGHYSVFKKKFKIFLPSEHEKTALKSCS